MTTFEPYHLVIGAKDIAGNGGRGRVFLLPGSEARARMIGNLLEDTEVRPSPRQLNVYLGRLTRDDVTVDVGVVATGMGCPSVNVVVTELILLGARRLLRVGTSGSLQPDRLKTGDLVIATAAVRDESTSDVYAPREFPAVAHPDWVEALTRAAHACGEASRTFRGVAHSKDSLYGREFQQGPRQEANAAYMKLLSELGVLVTEMETSHLLVLAASHAPDVHSIATPNNSAEIIKAGALLAAIGDEASFSDPASIKAAEKRAVAMALEAAVQLMRLEGPAAEAADDSAV